MQSLVWNLQLFADAGADTGASEGEANPNDSDVKPGDVAQGQDVKSADVEQNETDNPETTEESFEDLINGKFKDEYNKSVNDIVRKRLRGSQQELDNANEFRDSVTPVLNMLSEQYGVEPNNVEALTQKMLDDNARYEEEAMERGMDVDTLKSIKKLELANQQKDAELAAAREDAQMREEFNRIGQEAEALKEIYPNFNLEDEMANPDFAKMLHLGFSVQNTYESLHLQDILGSHAQAVASKEAERIASTIKANGQRPVENGVTSQHQPQKVSKKISSLSREEINAIMEKAANGESVTF